MATALRVVFVDSVHEVLWSRLIAMGAHCEDMTALSADEILPQLHQYDGIVIRSKFKITAALLGALPNLKFIARAGSGLENIDTEYCKGNNIQVFSSPEGNKDAVAEHATGMLLMLLNHLKRADFEVREGVWKRAENRGTELNTQTVGLIGYGVMGKAFAQRLKGFKCKVIAYDKYKTGFADDYVEEVSLEALKAKSTVISLHTNYLVENKYLLNASFIDEVKHPFVLINTARGFNVNTEDLVAGLQKGKILGACLDVLEYESVSFENVPDAETAALNYLKTATNVILTPHIAGWTHESHYKLSAVLAEKIKTEFFNV